MEFSFLTYDDLPDIPEPLPAADAMPDWWRSMPTKTSEGEGTVRRCAPFQDALGAGFLLRLPVDVRVELKEGAPRFSVCRPEDSWAKPLLHSQGQAPEAAGAVYKFVTGWAFDLPESHSMLVTHPLNRFELPFRSFSGVVDGGYDAQVNIPFSWLGSESTVLEAGTPIATMLPFLREPLEAETLRVSALQFEKTAVYVLQHPHAYRDEFRATREETTCR